MSTTTQHKISSRFAGISLDAYPHPYSVWMVVMLRLVMGGMMLFAGIGKLTGDGFNAGGYLSNVHAASPVSGLYATMASSAVMLDAINVIIPVTQVLIGVALLVGAFVRLAALGGALQMLMFYLGGWEGEWLALFDPTLIYIVVFAAIGAFAAGRVLGLDKYIETIRVGGQPLTERFPALRYLLG